MATNYAIENAEAQQLARLVEESTRASKEGVRFFIEPGPGVLARAMSKRHHIVFGQRGSGKSSLLQKVVVDLTISRTPIAYVDLEEFKGHTYPDVLVSVLIKTFTEFKKWLDTAATSPASKVRFWHKVFGAAPKKKPFNRKETAVLSADVAEIIDALFRVLNEGQSRTEKIQSSSDRTHEAKDRAGGKLISPVGLLNAELSEVNSSRRSDAREVEYGLHPVPKTPS